MIKAILPKKLNFKTTDDLIRIGRANDGGYLVSTADIIASDCLVGLGISDDWSFEEHFKSLNNVEVVAYDASVGKKKFLRDIIKSVLRPWRVRRLARAIKTLIKYQSFFNTKGAAHVEKFVGFDSIECLPRNNYFIHLSEILNNLDKKNVFFKIDVEGSEYRLLQTLLDYSEKISGCVIEFHDCDLHLEKIEAFVNSFELKLVHVHANNFSPICQKSKLPLVLELTFSKNGTNEKILALPNTADMPNNPKEFEIELSF
jgi:hypothetical protein